jgi:hypothetical protein
LDQYAQRRLLLEMTMSWIATGSVAIAMALAAGAAPAQTITGPIAGPPTLALGAYDLGRLHYVVEEYFISGQAQSYRPTGSLADDGRWSVEPSGAAPYVTRVVVVRPSDAAKFSGTVLVEWLNVSAGADGAPDWSYLHRELIRGGHAYVGVSAQKVGIDGNGAMAFGAAALKAADPARYGPLDHPGDAFSYDIFTQAGRAVRGGRLLGPLKARHVLAAGESQSAVHLTTYINAIAPLAKAFDGYLVHSRFGGAARIEGGYLPGAQAQSPAPQPARFRTDLKTPVLAFISETDLMVANAGYLPARQPDTDTLRVWEVAGTAHADTYTLAASAVDSGLQPIEDLARAFRPTDNLMGLPLGKPMNAAPQHHYVLQAAFAALERWVRTGAPPPKGARLKTTTGSAPELVLDEVGNAIGGVRSPWMDAPTARLSGLGQSGGGFAFLFGVTEPFDAARLQALYPGGSAEYLTRFNAALDRSVKAGFILAADVAEIRELAAAMYPA